MKLVNQYICYSGGAEGADAYFEFFAKKFNIQVVAFSYKTKYHNSENKYELSHEQFKEGVQQVYIANQVLKRSKINKYLHFLARNWFQVKNADEVFAVACLKEVNGCLQVKGGTAWAVQMAIDAKKNIYVFNQETAQWLYYDYYYLKFKPLNKTVKITTHHFAGIGTRALNFFGMQAIEDLFKNTFNYYGK